MSTYPEYANIGGQRYRIRTDFQVALRCFEVIEDATICDEERTLAVLYLLFGFIPPVEQMEAFLVKAKLFLQCGKSDEEQNRRTPDMDFELDRKYINASFMSDYRIDLSQAELHWWQFCELLEGLTEDCALSRVRALRGYDLTEIKDAKSRQKIAAAQMAVALPKRHTQEELDAIDEFERLMRGG